MVEPESAAGQGESSPTAGPGGTSKKVIGTPGGHDADPKPPAADPRARAAVPNGRAAAPGGPLIGDTAVLSTFDIATVDEVLDQLRAMRQTAQDS